MGEGEEWPLTLRILEAVLIAALIAIFHLILAEIITPAVREWRERRKAAALGPTPDGPKPWDGG